jgi:hypothetical protein
MLWTGGTYGGGLIGLAIGGGAAATILLAMAARRGHIRKWRLPIVGEHQLKIRRPIVFRGRDIEADQCNVDNGY